MANQLLDRGDRDYRLAVIALIAAGLATFNALYTTQALLPTLTEEMGISPSKAALTVSATTGMLALCIMPASILSERFGRGPVLIVSALASTVLGLFLPLADDPTTLIILRALQGMAIAGVPAVAMAWISEELHPSVVPRAMGLYVAGTSLGGLTGRLIPALVLEVASWKAALFAGAVVAVVMAILMAFLLPRQHSFEPKSIRPRAEFAAMLGHLRNPQLVSLYLIAFLGMGSFVSLYNYLGFRMVHIFGLSPALVGAVFLLYLSGTWSSARAGAFIQRWGHSRVLLFSAAAMLIGLPLMAPASLVITLVGVLIFTAGFFAMHSTASGWIGVLITHDRAEASSMYSLSYYVGSSALGWVTGYFFSGFGWPGLLLFLGATTVGLVLLGAHLRHTTQAA